MSERQRRFIRNILSNYAATALGAVVFVALTPFIIATLGTEAYGIWVLIHAIGYFVNYLDIGFDDAMLKLQSEFDGEGNTGGIRKLLSTSMSVYLVIGGLACSFLFGLAALDIGPVFDVSEGLLDDFNLVLILLGLNLLISFPVSVVEGAIEGFQRFDIANAIDIVFQLTGALATVVILLMGFGIVGLAVMELVLSILSLIINLYAVKRTFPEIKFVPGFDRDIWRRLRSFGLWSFLDDLVTEGTAQIDKLIIPLFFSASMLTPYSLLMALATLVLLVSEPITDLFFPLASELKAKLATPDLKRLLYSGTRLVVYVVSPVAIVVALFGDTILEVWVGENYTNVAPAVLSVLVIHFFVSAIVWPATSILMGMGFVRRVFWFTVTEIVIGLLLILAFAPTYGLLGFVTALLTSNIICSLVLTFPSVCKEIRTSVIAYLLMSVFRPMFVGIPALGTVIFLVMESPNPSVWELIFSTSAVLFVQIVSVLFLGVSAGERALIWQKISNFKRELI